MNAEKVPSGVQMTNFLIVYPTGLLYKTSSLKGNDRSPESNVPRSNLT